MCSPRRARATAGSSWKLGRYCSNGPVLDPKTAQIPIWSWGSAGCWRLLAHDRDCHGRAADHRLRQAVDRCSAAAALAAHGPCRRVLNRQQVIILDFGRDDSNDVRDWKMAKAMQFEFIRVLKLLTKFSTGFRSYYLKVHVLRIRATKSGPY